MEITYSIQKINNIKYNPKAKKQKEINFFILNINQNLALFFQKAKGIQFAY